MLHIFIAEKLVISLSDPYPAKIQTSVTILTFITGSPNATTITWKKDGSVLDTSDGNTYDGGTVMTPSLTIKNVAQSDKGSYQCQVANLAGTEESNTVSLDVFGKYNTYMR